MTDMSASKAAAAARGRQASRGKPFAVALTMMLVIALIGLVLAVLTSPARQSRPRQHQVPGPETATPRPAP